MRINRRLGSLEVGSIVKGEVNAVARNFVVVHHGRPSSLYSRTFDYSTILMLEDIYETRQWNSSNANSYSSSTIHSYLNSTFLNLCAPVIKNNVKQVYIPYRSGLGNSDTIKSGEYGLGAKIWLPSGYEVGFTTSDSSYLPSDGAKFDFFLPGSTSDALAKRLAYLNGIATDWWLRSPWLNAPVPPTGTSLEDIIKYMGTWSVTSAGGKNDKAGSYTCGIRPALALPSTLFVSENGNLTEDNGLSGIFVKKAGVWIPVF